MTASSPRYIVCRPSPSYSGHSALAGADRAELQAAGVGERRTCPSSAGDRVGRPHGIAGQQQHAVLDRVADERRPVVAEEVVLVGAQLEERQRVGAVGADEVGRRAVAPPGSASARGAASGRKIT